MIVPMKKITVITLEKDDNSTVNTLRKLGVLHVQNEQLPQGQDLNTLQEKIKIVDSAIEVLLAREFSSGAASKQKEGLADWAFTAKHIIDLRKRIEQLEEYALTLVSRINQLKAWGDFEPEKITQLAKKNIFVRFFQIPLKEINLIPASTVVKKIFTAGGIANCVVISQGRAEIPFKEMPLPKIGLDKLRKRLSDDSQAMQSLKQEITKLSSYRADFMAVKNSLEKELELRQAVKGMGQSGALTYITGYVPFDKIDSVTQTAKKEKWGLVLREPSQEDNVPVLIRNPR